MRRSRTYEFADRKIFSQLTRFEIDRLGEELGRQSRHAARQDTLLHPVVRIWRDCLTEGDTTETRRLVKHGGEKLCDVMH